MGFFFYISYSDLFPSIMDQPPIFYSRISPPLYRSKSTLAAQIGPNPAGELFPVNYGGQLNMAINTINGS